MSFTKPVHVSDPKIYINQCCWGGDVVTEQLLPEISEKFEDVQAGQEDWGWFIWFSHGKTRLVINIFCDDPAFSKFRIHLYANRKKLSSDPEDAEELENLRQIVCAR